MADFPFLNKESMTSDQKFLLMLLERLEVQETKVQEQEVKIKALEVDLKGKSIVISESAKELYDTIKNLQDTLVLKENNEENEYLEKNVPENILAKLSSRTKEDLLQVFKNIHLIKTRSYVSYFVITLLENYENADEEFITWFTNKINMNM